MKHLLVIALCVGVCALPAMAQKTKTPAAAAAPAKAVLKSTNDSVSYGIGVTIGTNIHEQKLDVNAELVARGLVDAMKGTLACSNEALQKVLMAFQQQMQERQSHENSELGEKNKRASEAFLAQNGKRPGVITTASGLQYEVIKEGTGRLPADTDKVTVHYKGTLIDGKVFDSSIDRGEPATFGVHDVIPGWVEALKLMKEGSKWKLYIPPQLAYGERGQGPIAPNSALIFEVELLKIN